MTSLPVRGQGRFKFSSALQRIVDRGLIVASALFVLLMFFGGGESSWRTLDDLWNIGHIGVFALWCFLAARHWRRLAWLPFQNQLIRTLAVVLLLSLGIETIQLFIGRTFDLGDIAKNIIGCLSAYAFFIPARRSISSGLLRGLQAVTALMIIGSIMPLVRSAWDDWAIYTQAPTLSDMENPFETERWSGPAILTVERSIRRRGNASLKIDLDIRQYSGAALEYFMRDWRGYRFLDFDIYNPNSEPLLLTCRVDDADHINSGFRLDDRFNRKLRIDPGWNAIEIPIAEIRTAPRTREIDLARIHSFMVFAAGLEHPRTVYIDAVRLRR